MAERDPLLSWVLADGVVVSPGSQELALLERMTAALKLSWDRVQILPASQVIAASFHSRVVCCLGLQAESLSEVRERVVRITPQSSILELAALAELLADPAQKKRAWDLLRPWAGTFGE
jgi:hypothetical protein